jgi:hypothetical protein
MGDSADGSSSIEGFHYDDSTSVLYERKQLRNRSTFHMSCVVLAVATSLVFATCVDGIHHPTAFIGYTGNQQRYKWHHQPGDVGHKMLSFQPPNSLRLVVHPSFRKNKIDPSFVLARRNAQSILKMASDTETAKAKRGRPKDSPEDDDAEWKTILAAFQMYKAAYGDLKVPSRFVVPGMAPWPGEFVDLWSFVLCVCEDDWTVLGLQIAQDFNNPFDGLRFVPFFVHVILRQARALTRRK